MSYNYAQFVQELANLAGTTTTQPNFVIELSNAIDYGEQRIFRDLDLISNQTQNASVVCIPGNMLISVPALFISVTQVAIITPAGSGQGSGKLNPLTRASKDVINALWPDPTVTGPPRYWDFFTQGYGGTLGSLVVGPSPDAAYLVNQTGTQRPPSLSASNPNTFLSTTLPDLFLIACMIHMQAYQKNWSSIGNDTAAAMTWEAQYQKLMVGASAEELRKRYDGSTVLPPRGEDTQPPSPDAKP